MRERALMASGARGDGRGAGEHRRGVDCAHGSTGGACQGRSADGGCVGARVPGADSVAHAARRPAVAFEDQTGRSPGDLVGLSEMRYLFRHTLMRDAAYNMQLQARLRELHALAGEAIEQVYAADPGPHYADLAYHYGKAQNSEQEFRYAKLAGERAAARFANQEAIGHFNQARPSSSDC